MTTIEIQGQVIYVNTKNRRYSKIITSFQTQYRLIIDPPLFLEISDIIHGFGTLSTDPRFGPQITISQYPLVLLANDREWLIQSLIRALKSRARTESVLQNIGKISDFYIRMDQLACDWNKYNNPDIFLPYASLLSKGKFIQLATYWYEHRCLRRLKLLGLSDKELALCNEFYNVNTIYSKILDNVYSLPMLSLEKCQSLLDLMGRSLSPRDKLAGIVIRTIWNTYMVKKGWTCVPLYILKQKCPEYEHCHEKLFEFGVRVVEDSLLLDYPFRVQTFIADYISDLVFKPNINSIRPILDDNLSPAQKKAVTMALTNNISIISGAAGSGKTTVIKALTLSLNENKVQYKVVAFTGKAVARLQEVLGKKSPSTMNRLMLKRNVNFQHLIIDEASMVTSPLFFEFLNKFSGLKFAITLVGDPNQLPPIGWGCFFKQILDSQIVPQVQLSQVYRTENKSDNGILINANKIIENKLDRLTLTENFNFFNADLSIIEPLVRGLIDNGIESNKIVILAPFKNDCKSINLVCQNIFNQHNPGLIDAQGQSWKLHDRVMMRENNYDINVMNGEEGTITAIEPDSIKVSFKGSGTFNFGLTTGRLTIESLELSYALSIHRSEGSEWPYVILYVPKGAYTSFCNRNLIYTAITRAAVAIWCVGDIETFEKCASTPAPYRSDNLNQMLKSKMRIWIPDRKFL